MYVSRMLSLCQPTDEDIRSQVDHIPELQSMRINESRSRISSQATEMPTIEVMKVLLCDALFKNFVCVSTCGGPKIP
mgnify:CR=1 FL=1